MKSFCNKDKFEIGDLIVYEDKRKYIGIVTRFCSLGYYVHWFHSKFGMINNNREVYFSNDVKHKLRKVS